ncbi:DNA-directed DNA polymerase [Synchytrium microbalum]|uniref:DNA polymerase lambda n=1 Tax=Synchytrium microbalum TaxID=1806994 RepID=A0A507CE60_9FUNG|nr:DNA-directed DNA polymerase [Synchytrium microbalum]TPX35803.1 DNA-directed DNA polymerase [Synchytrium microbalum]
MIDLTIDEDDNDQIEIVETVATSNSSIPQQERAIQPDMMNWELNSSVLVGSYKTSNIPNAHIASFDLDHTLFRPKNDRTHFRGSHEFKLTYQNVPQRLREIHNSGHRIIIFSNQVNLRKTLSDEKAFKHRVEAFCKMVDIPILVFAATEHDLNRKPDPNMFNIFINDYNGGVDADRTVSFFVGDAFGKILEAGDKSVPETDALFARNVNLAFLTPAHVFESNTVIARYRIIVDTPSPTVVVDSRPSWSIRSTSSSAKRKAAAQSTSPPSKKARTNDRKADNKPKKSRMERSLETMTLPVTVGTFIKPLFQARIADINEMRAPPIDVDEETRKQYNCERLNRLVRHLFDVVAQFRLLRQEDWRGFAASLWELIGTECFNERYNGEIAKETWRKGQNMDPEEEIVKVYENLLISRNLVTGKDDLFGTCRFMLVGVNVHHPELKSTIFSRGGTVVEAWDSAVNYILTKATASYPEVLAAIGVKSLSRDVAVVDKNWLGTCVSARQLVDVVPFLKDLDPNKRLLPPPKPKLGKAVHSDTDTDPGSDDADDEDDSKHSSRGKSKSSPKRSKVVTGSDKSDKPISNAFATRSSRPGNSNSSRQDDPPRKVPAFVKKRQEKYIKKKDKAKQAADRLRQELTDDEDEDYDSIKMGFDNFDPTRRSSLDTEPDSDHDERAPSRPTTSSKSASVVLSKEEREAEKTAKALRFELASDSSDSDAGMYPHDKETEDTDEESEVEVPASKEVGKKIRYQASFQCMKDSPAGVSKNACANEALVQELERILARAKISWDKSSQFRVLQYQKAINSIKKHPKQIETYEEARAIPNIGDGIGKKIKEFISKGTIAKANYVAEDEASIAIFTSITGTGVLTARKWYSLGARTIEDVRRLSSTLPKPTINLTSEQKIGVTYYEELKEKMPRSECGLIGDTIIKIAKEAIPNLECYITGSYRRGLPQNGDVDILVTHPRRNMDEMILTKIIPPLKASGVVTDEIVTSMTSAGEEHSLWRGVAQLKGGMHRRVDILIVEYEELGAALLYFTGNDVFNRSLRKLARVKGLRLNQYGLYSNVVRDGAKKLNVGTRVAGKTEIGIFEALGVPFREPDRRNCGI